MLLEFSIGNYRSIREPVTLSMLGTHLRSPSEDLDARTLATLEDGRKVLRSAVIYGPNASGKSNIVLALSALRWLVLNSAREVGRDTSLPVEPFLLDATSTTLPTRFEVVFVAQSVQYRYGVDLHAEKIREEWLYSRALSTSRETRLFRRVGDRIELGRSFPEGRRLESKTRENALFISVCEAFNGEIAQRVVSWFQRLGVLTAAHHHPLHGEWMDRYTADILAGRAGPGLRPDVLGILRGADLGIEEVSVQYRPLQETLPAALPEAVRELILGSNAKEMPVVSTLRARRGAAGEVRDQVSFSLSRQESDGTQKLFRLAGAIADTLRAGDPLVVDELDARLHPLLTAAIVDQFHSPEPAARRAQLVFATHDVSLLSPERFRRDQVWFMDKDPAGASRLFSLAEFQGVRQDEAFQRSYLSGRYGALPWLGGFARRGAVEQGS